jgi:hypothetical protein
MTQEEKDMVCYCVDKEGFDYCFRFYDTFKEVDDKKFHELRKAYVKASIELERYIGWDEYEDRCNI